MNTPPRFIVVDGPDGTGKTTLVRSLTQRLIAAGIPAVPARNPAGTKLGSALRQALIEVTPEEQPSPIAQLYAQVAAATQLVTEQLLPNLNKGFVIFDRYLLSLAVYQGLLPQTYLLDFIPRYAQATAHLPQPGFTVILEANPQTIIERIAKRNEVGKGRSKKAAPKDVMESEAKIHGQVAGFNFSPCFLPPHVNYARINTETHNEQQTLDVVWNAMQQIWPREFDGGRSDLLLDKSRDALAKF